MSSICITATGTDVGKTYIAALLAKRMKQEGFHVGYYKAALSGADSVDQSDAGYVNRIACLHQPEHMLLSYLYKTPVSPHLAAKLEGNPASMDRIKADYARVAQAYEHVIVEGSGGIVCPIRYDQKSHIFLEDIISEMNLPALLVADTRLGTINRVVLTISYMQQKGIDIKGIIYNQYTGSVMEQDNIYMIEEITGIKTIALVEENATQLSLSSPQLLSLFQKGDR